MKALVLLHGWGMTPALFDELASRLSASCTVHALPLPGYCGAEAASRCTITTLAQDVAARAPARCFVAGWSLGGQVALQWSRLHPQQLLGLALIGTTPSFVQRDGWTHAVEARVFREFSDSMETNRDATLKRFASLQAQGDVSIKAAASRLRACVTCEPQASTATLQDGLRVLLETDLREALRDIEHDALVIHGDNDRLVPVAAGEYLARTLKRGRSRIIPGAAHAPFVTQVDAVAAALQDFVQ